MDDFLEETGARSYSQLGNKVTVYAKSSAVLEQLPIERKSSLNLKQRFTSFIKPRFLDRDCSPDYKAFRKWSLAANAIGGVMGFMATQVYLDSQQASYSNSEAITLAGVLTGGIGTVAQLAGSSLANLGDSDPKKSYLLGQTINTASTAAALGILSALPGGHLPVFATTAITGALGNTLASAADRNIFNHLVPGPSKGDVASKNGNQDIFPMLLSLPVGIALGRLAVSAGMPPGILGAVTLAPLKAFFHLQAARSLQMTPLTVGQLTRLCTQKVSDGSFESAPEEGIWDTIKGLFGKDSEQGSCKVDFVSDLSELVSEDAEFMFGEFASEKYMIWMQRSGRAKIALQERAGPRDVLRAFMHAELLAIADRPGSSSKTPQQLISQTRSRLPEPEHLYRELTQQGWHLALDNLELPTVKGDWRAEELRRQINDFNLRR
jgi:hypothetical protein